MISAAMMGFSKRVKTHSAMFQAHMVFEWVSKDCRLLYQSQLNDLMLIKQTNKKRL